VRLHVRLRDVRPLSAAAAAIGSFLVIQAFVEEGVIGEQMALPSWWPIVWFGVLVGSVWQEWFAAKKRHGETGDLGG
jgi:hypothetical protein